MEQTEKKNRGLEQASAQMDSIADMVSRLNHCMECSDSECDLEDKEIYAGLQEWYKEGDKATEEQREKYHDEDEARQRIQEDALSVEVRQDWHAPGSGDEGPTDYTILLCTGGPACRIIGDLNRGEPETARMEYQDWFTPWETYHDADEETLLTYAREFYYGED